MSAIPFTPPHVSINRVRIIDLPGLAIDDAVRGRSGYELFSARAVIEYAREEASALELPPQFFENNRQTHLALPVFVDDCLRSERDETRLTAEAIGRRLGRNLGHIILTLHRGDAINRAARFDWSEDDWERWRRIERIRMGGGVMSGALGERIVRHARFFLDEMGYGADLDLALSPHRRAMTMLGAARYLPSEVGDTLVFDFGHTRAKRGCIRIENGVITELLELSPMPVDISWLDTFPQHNPESGLEVLDFISTVVADTRTACLAQGFGPGPDLMLVVAAYVEGGQLLGNGLYTNLNQLAADARPLLEQAIRSRSKQNARVQIIHDGTAAAATHAGEPNAAVILVGTALGVGFPPPGDHNLHALKLSF